MMAEAKKPEVGDTWYRCEDRRFGVVDEHGDLSGSYAKLDLLEFKVVKVTPKGVRVSLWGAGQGRFILLTANKRYAHPSEAEALESLLARRARQIRILQRQVRDAEEVVAMAKSRLAKLKPVELPKAESHLLADTSLLPA